MLSLSRVTPDPEDVRAMADHERKAAREQHDVISPEVRAMWALRVFERWGDLRARRDAELHCRASLAIQRYSTPYSELPSKLQNFVNQDVDCVLNNFVARLTDGSFDYLSHDRRARLEPEVGTDRHRIDELAAKAVQS